MKTLHTRTCENNANAMYWFIFLGINIRKKTILRRSWLILSISSVQFSLSVVSVSLWPHELQHTRPPCPSPTPGPCSKSCPLSQWCHPTILTSVVPFFSCPQPFPASGSFSMSQFFASGGQSIGVSASASALPINIQDWFLNNKNLNSKFLWSGRKVK